MGYDMSKPLNHDADRMRLAAQQLWADIVAKLSASYPNASPELLRARAAADIQARKP